MDYRSFTEKERERKRKSEQRERERANRERERGGSSLSISGIHTAVNEVCLSKCQANKLAKAGIHLIIVTIRK